MADNVKERESYYSIDLVLSLKITKHHSITDNRDGIGENSVGNWFFIILMRLYYYYQCKFLKYINK